MTVFQSLALLRRTLVTSPSAIVAPWGNLAMRVSIGLMLAIIHGWHKVAEGLAHFLTGTEWGFVHEVAELGFPAPAIFALMAGLTQLFGGLFIAVGLFTRPAAFMVADSLAVATFQNFHSHRNPQLPLLYLISCVALMLWGGGKFSLDARLEKRTEHMKERRQ